ncbi:hypothetical protein [Uliginosibacterium sediminicola]|uniref:Tail sheath protein subtilisin-like domain-containing protein n=1 Tax=Uliginosibacterium sediminicola TaxID=2024550 RepID=A0ABU9YVY8_9RHOO
MSNVPFVRQLDKQSGVQLNPLRDASEIPSGTNSDQVFAIAMRATRGRIDKPFVVTRANVKSKLGKGEQMRVSALNEAWVHVNEALNNGAAAAVVHRLTTSAAVIKWAVLSKDGTSFSVVDTAPESDFLLAFHHLDCFNDGIVLSYHADSVRSGGLLQPTSMITVRLSDRDGAVLHEYTGSLQSDATDDYGESLFLPDVIAERTEGLVVLVGVSGDEAVIQPASAAYGVNSAGAQKWVKSDVLLCFVEGGSAYSVDDYTTARTRLQRTPLAYGFISSGGSMAPGLIGQLVQLAYDTNRQFRFDVPGSLTPQAAAAFVEQLNVGASQTAQLVHVYWAPLKTSDPTSINPKGYFGVATLNIAYACARNAVKNAKGFAPKNYPIAGREWPINRGNVTQTYDCEEDELSDLAKAKINPVIHQEYTGGGRYVFYDSLTSAKVDVSLKALISVADMSSSIDLAVTTFCKDSLQLPMEESIRRDNRYLEKLFQDAEDSGWLKPSDDPAMEGKSFRFEVVASQVRPYDTKIVNYWLRYDGTNRQTFVTQTLTR